VNKDKLLLLLASFIVIACIIVAIKDKKHYNKILIECKKSLYYYFLFARATNRERAQLKHIFGNKMIGEKEIAIVRAMIERYKIEEKIHTILSREIKAVRKIVSTYQGSAAQKKMLSELLEYNLNRSK
jgi:geranylgeranyl pyrophosphate synthase